MKSLHLVKTSSGADWAYRLMRDLVSYGEEVHVAMPLGGVHVQKYKNAGVIVHEINYSLLRPLSTVLALRKIVKDVNPDIIHSHFVLTTLIMRVALIDIRIPRVFEVPGPLHLEHSLYRNVDILSAHKKIDFWIPTCKWSYDTYVRNGIDTKRLFLTYYGGDLADKQYTRGLLRSELNLMNGEKIVGMVAYMYAPKRFLGQKRGLKGHEDLIDAVSLIQDKYPDMHLVFIGGPWNGAEKYAERVVEYGKAKVKNVHFLGTRRNVPDLYQDIDVVVHPSHTENLGGAAESLLLSVPTIATSVGGFLDIVIPGKTGFLVPPKNPVALSCAIEKVINNYDEAKRLATNGCVLLKEILNSQNTSRDVWGFYRDIQNIFNSNNR